MPSLLTPDLTEAYRSQGFVTLPGGVAPETLAALRAQLDDWIEDSRGHDENYGTTENGKARFDLEEGHTREAPRLRRVMNPCDISEAYEEAIRNAPFVDMLAELIGPDVKFHHCKLNVKLPGMATHVDFHSDHAFEPHTNSDQVTALLLLDDMNESNGCLRVIPGSHRQFYDHFQNGRFVGAIDKDLAAELAPRSLPVVGKAGDVCLMHVMTLHGSGPNLGPSPRRLFIAEYTAADAWPLVKCKVLSRFTGEVVRGRPTRSCRLEAGIFDLPPYYKADSFFSVQGQKTAAPH
ncbi:phytanoyl-CoA dioxygenase family protein [Algihabitans albus]|uniref:phytanoyl-CoA dioxygenase family protein n=1 Tax=Algihabitans albus TaxID=2164067 RepID=UPI000E5D51FD|nr:phytanoyl-CoA dioxygenase family protein [Algihabitans albus]